MNLVFIASAGLHACRAGEEDIEALVNDLVLPGKPLGRGFFLQFQELLIEILNFPGRSAQGLVVFFDLFINSGELVLELRFPSLHNCLLFQIGSGPPAGRCAQAGQNKNAGGDG